MDQDFAQRRRVALAVAITVILVPAAFLLNRGAADSAPPSHTLVGAVQIPGQTTPDDDPTDDGPAETDPMGSTPIAYLDGTVPSQADDPATIAIPRPPQSINGSASFSRDINDPVACQIRDMATIPFQSRVTVTNLDNNHSVQCVVSVGGVPPDFDVVLNADAFLRIGDLTDAPLSVEISW
jgi:hypothetical protein